MGFVTGEQFVMIDDFLIDVSLTEEHEFDSDVTEYPVESGADISDNIRPRPLRVMMEGVVSATPLPSIVAARPTRTNVINEDVQVGVNPAVDAYQLLVAIRDQREPVTIRTSLDTYKNMALESLSIPRDAGTGDALRFRATFRQIRTVENRRSLKRVAVPNGKGKDNLGQLLSNIKGLLGTPVISFPQSQRNVTQKQFGKPIASSVEGVGKNEPGVRQAPGVRLKDGLGALDHFKLTEKLQKQWTLDGYVSRGVYYRVVNDSVFTGSEKKTVFDHDLGKRTWVSGESSLFKNGSQANKTPPGYDHWGNVTNPKDEPEQEKETRHNYNDIVRQRDRERGFKI